MGGERWQQGLPPQRRSEHRQAGHDWCDLVSGQGVCPEGPLGFACSPPAASAWLLQDCSTDLKGAHGPGSLWFSAPWSASPKFFTMMIPCHLSAPSTVTRRPAKISMLSCLEVVGAANSARQGPDPARYRCTRHMRWTAHSMFASA